MTKLTITMNTHKRIFTIREGPNKYRTSRFGRWEFEQLRLNTEIEWLIFLENSNEYKKIN